MSKRSYQHYCPLVSALDLIGERWTLLIVRDLLLGPKRYKDLLHGLSGIGTNILAARLKELEEARIIRRRVLSPPAGSTVYELTEYGRELEDIILSLSRWGARSLRPRQPDQIFKPITLMLDLRENYRVGAVLRTNILVEMRFEEDEVYAIEITEGTLKVHYGSANHPDLIVNVDIETFLQLQARQFSTEEAQAQGLLRLDGKLDLWPVVFDLFPPAHLYSAER